MSRKWKCTVCGYIHDGDSPPDQCPVCGYIFDGDLPDRCPVCQTGQEDFNRVN